MAFVFGLLAVGIGFAVKRWREYRSYKADLEYERRRWGREQALEVTSSAEVILLRQSCFVHGSWGPHG